MISSTTRRSRHCGSSLSAGAVQSARADSPSSPSLVSSAFSSTRTRQRQLIPAAPPAPPAQHQLLLLTHCLWATGAIRSVATIRWPQFMGTVLLGWKNQLLLSSVSTKPSAPAQVTHWAWLVSFALFYVPQNFMCSANHESSLIMPVFIQQIHLLNETGLYKIPVCYQPSSTVQTNKLLLTLHFWWVFFLCTTRPD